tara:strand:- start:183737 stop:184324 length:588 start_codon:yes stop_codon:yes gene_type:complete
MKSSLTKLFIAAALPTMLAGCATRFVHDLNDECLHRVSDDKGTVLSVEFDDKCGAHKRDLATSKIDAEGQNAILKIEASETAQINVIQQEKTKIFWTALATRAAFEIGNPQQEDTATRLLIAARSHEDLKVRDMVLEAQNEIGITPSMLNDKNQIWDKIRQTQATPGIQVIELGNGEFYMDKFKHAYGPLAPIKL